MIVSLVAALATNRVIGRGNALPWHLPDDLKRFRALTGGGVIVMGRKTYDSIGKPLPKRQNWVISRSSASELQLPEAVRVASSLDQAFGLIEAGGVCREVFVIGGAQIYEAALSRADRLYLTLIDHPVEGDAFFPEWRERGFQMTSEEFRTDPFGYRFTQWERCD